MLWTEFGVWFYILIYYSNNFPYRSKDVVSSIDGFICEDDKGKNKKTKDLFNRNPLLNKRKRSEQAESRSDSHKKRATGKNEKKGNSSSTLEERRQGETMGEFNIRVNQETTKTLISKVCMSKSIVIMSTPLHLNNNDTSTVYIDRRSKIRPH